METLLVAPQATRMCFCTDRPKSICPHWPGGLLDRPTAATRPDQLTTTYVYRGSSAGSEHASDVAVWGVPVATRTMTPMTLPYSTISRPLCEITEVPGFGNDMTTLPGRKILRQATTRLLLRLERFGARIRKGAYISCSIRNQSSPIPRHRASHILNNEKKQITTASSRAAWKPGKYMSNPDIPAHKAGRRRGQGDTEVFAFSYLLFPVRNDIATPHFRPRCLLSDFSLRPTDRLVQLMQLLLVSNVSQRSLPPTD